MIVTRTRPSWHRIIHRLVKLSARAISRAKGRGRSGGFRRHFAGHLELLARATRAIADRRTQTSLFYLHQSLHQLPTPITGEFSDCLHSAVVQLSQNPERRPDVSEALLHDLQRSNCFGVGHFDTLRHLTLLIGGLGLIRPSEFLRRDTLRQAQHSLSLPKAGTWATRAAVWSLAIAGKWDDLQKALSAPRVTLERERLAEPARDFMALCMKECIDYESAADDQFLDLVRGRTVALVGTGQLTDVELSVATRCSTVIRMRPIVTKALVEQCDIAYLSDDMASELYSSGRLVPLMQEAECKMIVTKKVEFRSLPAVLASRTLRSLTPQVLTTATSGTLAIWDVIRAQPASLYLCGFDLYSAPTMYRADWLQQYSRDPAALGLAGQRHSQRQHLVATTTGYSIDGAFRARSFLSHEIISDHGFINRLFRDSGLIHPSTLLRSLLNLSPAEYGARLEEALGLW